MSVRVSSKVWDEATEYSGGPLLILLALADWSNDEGWCWPSIPAIARKSRLSERQVYAVLGQLEDDGVIEKRSGGGRGNFTKYRVIVAALGRPRNPEAERRVFAQKNPEVTSGFPDTDPEAERAVEMPVNPEAERRVSEKQNPEADPGETLKSAARNIEEPSYPSKNHQVPPVVPHADARGTRREDTDSSAEGKLDPHVDAVMQACRFTQRRLRRVLVEQMRMAVNAGTAAPSVQIAMIAAWRYLQENRDLLRYSWGATRFFAEGHWRVAPASWPWDQRAIDAQRAARVGVA